MEKDKLSQIVFAPETIFGETLVEILLVEISMRFCSVRSPWKDGCRAKGNWWSFFQDRNPEKFDDFTLQVSNKLDTRKLDYNRFLHTG